MNIKGIYGKKEEPEYLPDDEYYETLEEYETESDRYRDEEGYEDDRYPDEREEGRYYEEDGYREDDYPDEYDDYPEEKPRRRRSPGLSNRIIACLVLVGVAAAGVIGWNVYSHSSNASKKTDTVTEYSEEGVRNAIAETTELSTGILEVMLPGTYTPEPDKTMTFGQDKSFSGYLGIAHPNASGSWELVNHDGQIVLKIKADNTETDYIAEFVETGITLSDMNGNKVYSLAF